ncbi:MAG: hypothetical protein IPJ94_25165 [Chloroflexi bacterium]|nr:hypothetical protein [Chloroflexota bacterium]
MRNIINLIISALLMLLAGILVIVLVAAWAMGLGWLLSQIVPFSWFEATLLMLISSIVVGFTAVRLFALFPPPLDNEATKNTPFVLRDPIPLSRFSVNEEEVTDEAWLRFEIANEIFDNLVNMERELAMGEAQQKELAVRLTDVVVAVLKGRKHNRRTYSVRVTVEQLRKQLEAMGQQPYDTDLLETAVATTNMRLSYDEDLADVVRDKTWDSID